MTDFACPVSIVKNNCPSPGSKKVIDRHTKGEHDAIRGRPQKACGKGKDTRARQKRGGGGQFNWGDELHDVWELLERDDDETSNCSYDDESTDSAPEDLKAVDERLESLMGLYEQWTRTRLSPTAFAFVPPIFDSLSSDDAAELDDVDACNAELARLAILEREHARRFEKARRKARKAAARKRKAHRDVLRAALRAAIVKRQQQGAELSTRVPPSAAWPRGWQPAAPHAEHAVLATAKRCAVRRANVQQAHRKKFITQPRENHASSQ